MGQITAQTSKLDTLEGLKELFGGGFLGKRAKANLEFFRNVSTKGVAHATILATRDYGNDNVYHAVAFSTTDQPISPSTLSGLRERAEAIADELRTNGYLYYDTPTVWDGGGKLWISKSPKFRDLSLPDEGIYVFPLQQMATTAPPASVAWAFADKALHIVVPAR